MLSYFKHFCFASFFLFSLKDFLVFYSLKYASFSSQRYTFIRKLLVRWWFGFSCLFYFKFCYVYISLGRMRLKWSTQLMKSLVKVFFFMIKFFSFFKAIFNLLRCGRVRESESNDFMKISMMIWWFRVGNQVRLLFCTDFFCSFWTKEAIKLFGFVFVGVEIG